MSSGGASLGHRRVACAACMKTFKRLFKHLSQSPACSLLYTTSHDPEQEPQVIDDARRDSSVAALPTARADDEFSSDDEGVGVFDAVSSHNMEFAEDDDISIGDNEVPVDDDISSDEEVDVNEDVSVDDKQATLPHDEVSSNDEDVLVDDELSSNDEDVLGDNEVDSASEDEDLLGDDEVDSVSNAETGKPDTSVLKLYHLLSNLRSNPLELARFSKEEQVYISLLQLLKEIKAPLNAFTRILTWAAKSNEDGHQFQLDGMPTREKIIQNLYIRYNMKGLIPKEELLYLPYTKRIVSMIYFDAKEVFASLLSCPTINQDENFLFHGREGAPFAEPLRSSSLGDIDTGRCYRKTHEALVRNPGVDMILPCIGAMDKTHIDSAGRMQMEPYTISNGLLNHAVRSQPSAMRILGYINHSTPAHKPEQSIDSSEYRKDFNNTDQLPPNVAEATAPLNPKPGVTWATYTLNEMHIQIRFIFEASGFLELQKNGFHWMLQYMGKTYPVVLHPYVPFIVGDTEGHDRLCGHYTARFAKIKQLCRACECPTEMTGYSQANYPHRKPTVIDRLVKTGKLRQLQLMSQNYLSNGFTDVRFGLHNNRGLFGACPGEMLHLISLGWFKYCLEAFSDQAGAPGTVPVKKYDSLCATIGTRLARQSDRDVPRTNFQKGFSSGANLMGHEFTGCLLVKLFALHTNQINRIFPKRKVAENPRLKVLRNPRHISDWILVVSSLLQWNQWMKQSAILKSQVARSHLAVQWLMRRVASVSPRQKKMGTNTIKTHLVLHLSEDMLDHGVPQNVNSAYAESAHIPLAKDTARRTQRRTSSFTKQAAHRYVKNLVISLASSDMVRDKVKKCGTPSAMASPLGVGSLTGRGFFITSSVNDASVPIFCWDRKMKNDDITKDFLEPYVMAYLTKNLVPRMPNRKLKCSTELKSKDGDSYRAHPNIYNGHPWHDKAMVKWRRITHPLPAFIHTFIDLRNIPHCGIKAVSGEKYMPGMYVVVHSYAAVVPNLIETPNTMIGRYTITRDSHSQLPVLYIVPVETIDSPTIGIQDVGGSIGADEEHLFLIRRMAQWPASWDSIITDEYQRSKRRQPSPEPQYDGSPVDVETMEAELPLQQPIAVAGAKKPSGKRKKRRW